MFREDLVLSAERRTHRSALARAPARRHPVVGGAHFLEQIAKETGQRRIYAPEAVGVARDRPSGRATCGSCTTWCARTWRCRTGAIITAELVQQCSGRQYLPACPPSMKPATSSRAITLSQILQITAGNVSQAARLARRNRTDFYKLLSRHTAVARRLQEELTNSPTIEMT